MPFVGEKKEEGISIPAKLKTASIFLPKAEEEMYLN